MDEKLQRDLNDILSHLEFISGEQQEAPGQAAEPTTREEEEMAPLPEQHGWQPPPPQQPPIIFYLVDAPPPPADTHDDYDQDYDSDAVESGLDAPGENEWEERQAPFLTQQAAATELPPRPSALHPRQTCMGTRLLVTLACVLFLVAAALATVLLLPLLTASATVTIIPRSRQVSTTTTLAVVTSGLPAAITPHERQVPGRVLSSLTLSQATSVATTGTGERPAQAAHGTITFFNSSLVMQMVPAGTTISGADGVVIVTDQDATIPAAVTLSTNGQATVLAHAVQAGPIGNIRAGDVYGPCCRLNVSAANSTFHGGAQARSFPVVTHADLNGAIASLRTSLMQSVQAAFMAQVHADETLLTPTCTPTVSADHGVGEEATRLGVTLDETCQAEAYSTQAMHDLVTQVTTQAATTQGGAGYHLSGNIEVSVEESSSTPTGQKQGARLSVLRVKGTGVWTYQFTDAQLQHLAQQIAGKSTREAKAILLATPGVQSVTLQLRSESETTLPRDSGQITMGQLIGLGL